MSDSANKLEEGDELLLDFTRFKSKSDVGVIPVAVQDIESGDVLLIGHVNEAALQHALRNKVATFWSLSRNELWVKGETSGNKLQLIEVRVNCEQNSLLYLVRLLGTGACHTKNKAGEYRQSCYYRRIRDGRLEFTE